MAKLKGISRPDKPLRTVHLLKVEGNANNNKFYDMYDTGDGYFIVFFGRVGADPQIEQYPISRWESKYREKLSARKGYKDITHLRVDAKGSVGFKDISDGLIARLILDLQRYAKALIENTYLVGSSAVTMTMIEEAQSILNELLATVDNGTPSTFDLVNRVNYLLTKLYTTIPRKMKNVRDHLISQPDVALVKKMIVDEQDNLDTMEGQVKAAQVEQENTDDQLTLLDAMGIKIFRPEADDIPYIKKLMGENAHQFRSAFRVTNVKTQARFNKWLETVDDKSTKDFWHGSRNQNWYGILNTGLLLRPTNVIISGKMFGYGLYFADKARKSIGYTSLTGSYWARGTENKAYLAIFQVHTGKQYHVRRHVSELNSFNWKRLREKGNYHSLFAEGGVDLRNNEYIIYNEDQAAIRFLVEIGN